MRLWCTCESRGSDKSKSDGRHIIIQLLIYLDITGILRQSKAL